MTQQKTEWEYRCHYCDDFLIWYDFIRNQFSLTNG